VSGFVTVSPCDPATCNQSSQVAVPTSAVGLICTPLQWSDSEPPPVVDQPIEVYITIAEAAEYLQVSDRTVRRLIADGELTGYWMGRSRRVIRVDLNEIDEQLMRPLNEPARPRKRRT
jgi:excisionase family DNA binding protein